MPRDSLAPSLSSDLWVFQVAAEAPTFQAAAERLFVTQSAVSQRITRLEKRLGLPLFERQGRTVALPSQGQALFASTQEAFAVLAPGRSERWDKVPVHARSRSAAAPRWGWNDRPRASAAFWKSARASGYRSMATPRP